VNPDRIVLRTSWISTAMAAILALSAPLTARLGEDRTDPEPLRAPAAVAAAVATLSPEALRTPSSVVGAAPVGQAQAVSRPEPHLLVHAVNGLVARRNPWAGAPAVGHVATVSKYYHVPLVLWVEQISPNGRWGRVELPYAWPRTEGWIPLEGLRQETTWVTVRVDLSSRTVRVYKRDRLLYRVAGAIGAPSSPTPPGDYVVTDRVPFARGGYLGSFAFGISGIQPRLPVGWSGGNQLAIHGTNNPASIGQAASAGCVRVSEWALERFKPLLRLGTPVLIRG
jgi:lipoprotein-anchoring transpeptidase ErfK/SrfK